MSIIICDLDGTLFNINHRVPLLAEKKWKEFYAACLDDEPNMWCLWLLHAMRNIDYKIVFVSGRNEICRTETEKQLKDLGFETEKLYMRPAANRDADYEFKEKLFDNTPALYEADVLFVIEDRQRVVDMWRSKGLTVLQCDEGGF